MTDDADGTSSRPRRVHRMGPAALLVDCAGLDDVLALHAALTEEPLDDQAELIPAATTLLVRFPRPLPPAAAREHARLLASAPGLDGTAGAVAEVRIPVVYDGEDLAAVARLLDCSEEEVVARHTGARWTAAFGGFSPGFAYLVQQNPSPETALSVPRRDSPRTRVPAGSVALAGDFSAVYPSDSPGGWQLIGRTGAPVWDLAQDPPALIVPGAPVRFEAVRDNAGTVGGPSGAGRSESAEGAADGGATAAGPAASASPALRVDAPGLSALVQDAGRPGHADWGVSPSGWADAQAAAAANRLVGNDAGAAVLENTAGGLRLTALEDVVLAVTGARTALTLSVPAEGDAPGRTQQVPQDRPFGLLAGQSLALAPTTAGLRAYVGVRGGVVVEPVMGSMAADTLSRLGSEPLARGAELAVGPAPKAAVEPVASPVALPASEAVTEICAGRGPRTDWFTDESLAALADTVWRVTEQSNRVGVRLEVAEPPRAAGTGGDGAAENAAAADRSTADDAPSSSDADDGALPSPLVRTEEARGRELPSEGLATGAIQVPPNGMPIVFLSDHPVTGGYPVVGVVGPDSLRLLAQAAPGTRVRLVLDTTDTLKES